MTNSNQENTDTSISVAISQLNTEQSRLSDEQTAFKRFRERIEEITPDPVAPTGKIIKYEQTSSMRTLSAVREAYTETVMDVAHYNEEYNDTYQQSITAEFGPETAILLTQSNQFSPTAKSSLLTEIDEAINRREQFQKIVDRELCSLKSAKSDIRLINNTITNMSETAFESATFDTLDECFRQMDVLVENCDKIAKNRQHDLAAVQRSWQAAPSDPDLQSYFYKSSSVTYPALARIGQIGERIINLQEKIKKVMIFQGDR